MKKFILFIAVLSMNAMMSFATAPAAAPTAPSYPANQVKAVYSATYAADCNFGDWGSGTIYTADTYGKKFTTTNLGYFGLVDFALNCSKMESLHMDVWFEAACSFRIVPIWGGTEKGVTITVAESDINKWKSVDVALNSGDWASIDNWTNIYQIKIDNVASQTFWLNNVYFYTTQAPEADTEAPSTPVIAGENGATLFSAFMDVKSTDNSGTVTFKVYDSAKANVLATANTTSGTTLRMTVGNLTADTKYKFYVQASDETGNTSEYLEVNVTTDNCAAPTAPAVSAKKVTSIFSAAYEEDVTFGIGGWGQSTQTSTGTIGTQEAMECLNSNYLGWELNKEIDVTHATHIHMDILNYSANNSTSIKFTPIWKDAAGTGHELGTAYTIGADGWTALDIELADFTNINKARIFQLKWDAMPAHIVIANVYFYGAEDKPEPAPAAEMTAPGVPTMDATNVQAIMCGAYENNLGYFPQGWGGCAWVDTCINGANFYIAKTMHWECFASDWTDLNTTNYSTLHFDIWFPEAGNAPFVKMEFNDTPAATAEVMIPGEFVAGWNSVNISLTETFGADFAWNKVKCITVKVSKEGEQCAWANFLLYNGTYTSKEATGMCGDRPAGAPEEAPTVAAVQNATSLLGVPMSTDLAFGIVDWGCVPQTLDYNGVPVQFVSNMTWCLYTNWAEDYYDLSAYNMLHVDIYTTIDSKIKVTLENLSVDNGGNGYKNGVEKALVANQWNGLELALSDFPDANAGVNPFEFIKYIIFEGFKLADGTTSAEGNPLAIGNVYFYNNTTGLQDVETTKTAQKSLRNGMIVIERNGVRYNVLGTVIE